jgi:hypothetical protein
MAMTYRTSIYNSTPFSSCCGVASMDRNGRPASKCEACGEMIVMDYDGLDEVRRTTPPGCCLMCKKPRHQCNC